MCATFAASLQRAGAEPARPGRRAAGMGLALPRDTFAVDGRNEMKLTGQKRWWGAAIGAIGGLLDTALFLQLGVDFTLAGRDLTLPVAGFLSANFAVLCFLIGHFMDARAQARADALTISQQMRDLEASQRAAMQNEKLAAIGRLAAGVAHEVRNPLGVIRASASMVQESFLPEDEAHRACGFICEESDRLNALITALLTFARPAEPRRAAIDIEKALDRALQITAHARSQRRVEVVREVLGTIPPAFADPDLLAQAVLDLMTNAVEAVAEGGQVALRVDSQGERVVVDVADDGPGVDEDVVDQLFEPFFTTKASGTGLGLAMTARIAEAHGGSVAYVRDSGAGPGGRGACFRLRLPVARTPAEAAA
jgi:two-component system sensor histidine kinase HydH